MAVCPVPLRFPAAAIESATFAWFTAPSSPGLWMRTEMFEFDGLTCSVFASALADWSLWATWPAPWEPPPAHLQSPPPCCWPAVCSVAFRFPAAATLPAWLLCVTGPLAPSLPMRTEMFSFFGATCSVVAVASASCVLPAAWPALCDPPPLCAADWPVTLALPATAAEPAWLACVTGPFAPGLKIRTSMFELLG